MGNISTSTVHCRIKTQIRYVKWQASRIIQSLKLLLQCINKCRYCKATTNQHAKQKSNRTILLFTQSSWYNHPFVKQHTSIRVSLMLVNSLLVADHKEKNKLSFCFCFFSVLLFNSHSTLNYLKTYCMVHLTTPKKQRYQCGAYWIL